MWDKLMVVRLTPASLEDGMPMNAWQRRRNLDAAGLTALADPDFGFADPPLSDDMPAPDWQRARMRVRPSNRRFRQRRLRRP